MESLEKDFNLKEELSKYLIRWPWFVLSVLFLVTIAFAYLRYSNPVYSIDASILIKDNKKSGISPDLAAFADLGILGGSANNPENEIEILKSRKIIGTVVDSLNLKVSYFLNGRIRNREIYNESPFELKIIKFKNVEKSVDTIINIDYIDSDELQITSADGEFSVNYGFDKVIDSKFALFKFLIFS